MATTCRRCSAPTCITTPVSTTGCRGDAATARRTHDAAAHDGCWPPPVLAARHSALQRRRRRCRRSARRASSPSSCTTGVGDPLEVQRHRRHAEPALGGPRRDHRAGGRCRARPCACASPREDQPPLPAVRGRTSSRRSTDRGVTRCVTAARPRRPRAWATVFVLTVIGATLLGNRIPRPGTTRCSRRLVDRAAVRHLLPERHHAQGSARRRAHDISAGWADTTATGT